MAARLLMLGWSGASLSWACACRIALPYAAKLSAASSVRVRLIGLEVLENLGCWVAVPNQMTQEKEVDKVRACHTLAQ